MKKKEVIAVQILSYLEQNPDAGDTLEGIATWWLEHQRVEQVVDEVVEALDYLLKKKEIRVFKLQSGSSFYKINQNSECLKKGEICD